MNEAAIPNPALKCLEFLVGKWQTEATHPYVPGKIFHGTTVFEWISGGAFLMMQSAVEEPEIPSGIAIFGSDVAVGKYYMLYFDERGVSRKNDVVIEDGALTWSRETPQFSQRHTMKMLDGGQQLESTGMMSRDGKPWEPDLKQTFFRKD